MKERLRPRNEEEEEVALKEGRWRHNRKRRWKQYIFSRKPGGGPCKVWLAALFPLLRHLFVLGFGDRAVVQGEGGGGGSGEWRGPRRVGWGYGWKNRATVWLAVADWGGGGIITWLLPKRD